MSHKENDKLYDLMQDAYLETRRVIYGICPDYHCLKTVVNPFDPDNTDGFIEPE